MLSAPATHAIQQTGSDGVGRKGHRRVRSGRRAGAPAAATAAATTAAAHLERGADDRTRRAVHPGLVVNGVRAGRNSGLGVDVIDRDALDERRAV